MREADHTNQVPRRPLSLNEDVEGNEGLDSRRKLTIAIHGS